jgi:hypothetical protein
LNIFLYMATELWHHAISSKSRGRLPVTRPNHARAPEGATGVCRERRRPQGERPPAWVRPYRQVKRALAASERLLDSTLRKMAASERCAHQRPIRASMKLDHAEGWLARVSRDLTRIVDQLAEANACIGLEPERAAEAPALLMAVTVEWLRMSQRLTAVADEVYTLHHDLLDALESGDLVPEPPAEWRARIILAPRPAPVRISLRFRKRRVVDRISPVLQRRRRTPRPAYVSVPQRNCQGRAPPPVSICLL